LHSISVSRRSKLKKFMIIVDHDRINDVPMIKSQEG
jgi:hypothetical protein